LDKFSFKMSYKISFKLNNHLIVRQTLNQEHLQDKRKVSLKCPADGTSV